MRKRAEERQMKREREIKFAKREMFYSAIKTTTTITTHITTQFPSVFLSTN